MLKTTMLEFDPHEHIFLSNLFCRKSTIISLIFQYKLYWNCKEKQLIELFLMMWQKVWFFYYIYRFWFAISFSFSLKFMQSELLYFFIIKPLVFKPYFLSLKYTHTLIQLIWLRLCLNWVCSCPRITSNNSIHSVLS